MGTFNNFESDQVITVFMSTKLNDIRLVEEPPLLKSDIPDPDHRHSVEAIMAAESRGWDIYRDIVQLSFYWNGTAYHLMLCDDMQWAAAGQENLVEPGRVVMFFSAEEDLIRAAFRLIDGIFGYSGGQCMYRRILVGWRMRTDIWPVLVNRALKYRIKVDSQLLVSPDSKWSGVQCIGDIETLYMQGGYGRKLPGLSDLLRFWGFGHDEHRPLPEDIAQAVCDDPVGTARHIERYLQDMHLVLGLYYGMTATDTPDPRSGMPVPITQ